MGFTFANEPLTFDQAQTILTASKASIDLRDHCRDLDRMSLVKLAADTGNIKFAEIALSATYAKKSSGKGSKKPKPCGSVIPLTTHVEKDEAFIEECIQNPTQRTYGSVFLLSTLDYLGEGKFTMMQIAISFLERWYASADGMTTTHKFCRGYTLDKGGVFTANNPVDGDRRNDPFAAPLYTALRQGLGMAQEMGYVKAQMVFNWSKRDGDHSRRRYNLIELTERGHEMLNHWDVNTYIGKKIEELSDIPA